MSRTASEHQLDEDLAMQASDLMMSFRCQPCPPVLLKVSSLHLSELLASLVSGHFIVWGIVASVGSSFHRTLSPAHDHRR